MKVVKLVKHAHMLGGDVSATNHLVDADTLAFDFLLAEGVFNDSVKVFLNSEPINRDGLESHTLEAGDTLNVVVTQAEPVSAYLAQATLGSLFTTALTNIAISFAVNLVTTALFGRDSGSQREIRKDPDAYGIVGGGNTVRKFQVIPVVLGRTRVFPDYSSPWVVDYVKDDTACRYINNGSVTYSDVPLPELVFTPTPADEPWQFMSVAEQTPAGFTPDTDVNPEWGIGSGAAYVFFHGTGEGGAGSSTQYNFAYRWTAPDLGRPANEGTIQWMSYRDYFIEKATSNSTGA